MNTIYTWIETGLRGISICRYIAVFEHMVQISLQIAEELDYAISPVHIGKECGLILGVTVHHVYYESDIRENELIDKFLSIIMPFL